MLSNLGRLLQVGLVAVGITVAMGSVAEAKPCSQLTEDLHAMQRAQMSLLDSMVHKNESMASTLDQYAETLQSKRIVRKTDLVGMKRSAQAFRNHQDREEKLVQRFQDRASELMIQVEACLKSNTVASE